VTSPPTVTLTLSVPTLQGAPDDNVTGIRAAYDQAWIGILKIEDDYHYRVDVMGNGLDVNYYRENIIPDAVTAYATIRDNLSAVQPLSADLAAEKTTLMTICTYKGSMLEGLGESVHGDQFAEDNFKKARSIYLDAKYLLQGSLDALNTIPDPARENAPLYLQKYATMITEDKATIQDEIDAVEGKILIVTVT
jgi:hypothetical protein